MGGWVALIVSTKRHEFTLLYKPSGWGGWVEGEYPASCCLDSNRVSETANRNPGWGVGGADRVQGLQGDPLTHVLSHTLSYTLSKTLSHTGTHSNKLSLTHTHAHTHTLQGGVLGGADRVQGLQGDPLSHIHTFTHTL